MIAPRFAELLSVYSVETERTSGFTAHAGVVRTGCAQACLKDSAKD